VFVWPVFVWRAGSSVGDDAEGAGEPARALMVLAFRQIRDRWSAETMSGVRQMLLAPKMELDADRSAGQFVPAGSARFLTMRRIGETLTGRIGIVELMPLSAGEIRGLHETFVERAFRGDLLDHRAEPLSWVDYARATTN